MVIAVTAAGDPDATGADLVAVTVGARAAELGVPERAAADADPIATVYREPAAPLVVIALEPGVEGLRTAAARAVRACRGGGILAWALDRTLPLTVEEQVHAAGWGATVISRLAMEGFAFEAPPRAISLPDDLLIPYSPSLEDEILPSEERIAAAIRELVG